MEIEELNARPLHAPQMGIWFVVACVFAFLLRATVDVGSEMTLTIANIALYPIAAVLPPIVSGLVMALPMAGAELLFVGWEMVPCVLLVQFVCGVCMSYVYGALRPWSRPLSVLPFFVHGVLLVLGMFLYQAFAFGLLVALPGLAIVCIEWVATGCIGMVVLRSLHHLPIGARAFLLGAPPSDEA